MMNSQLPCCQDISHRPLFTSNSAALLSTMHDSTADQNHHRDTEDTEKFVMQTQNNGHRRPQSDALCSLCFLLSNSVFRSVSSVSSVVNLPDARRQIAERVRRMFGQIAGRYDFLNHLLSLSIDRYWRWRTVRLVPPATGPLPILDVCTGTGDLALAYDRAAGGQTPIVAADFCHEMLDDRPAEGR